MLDALLPVLMLVWFATVAIGVATVLTVVVVAIGKRAVPERWLAMFGLFLGVAAGVGAWFWGAIPLAYGGATALSWPLWFGGMAVAFASAVALCVLGVRFLAGRS
jgi:hypothetical protein